VRVQAVNDALDKGITRLPLVKLALIVFGELRIDCGSLMHFDCELDALRVNVGYVFHGVGVSCFLRASTRLCSAAFLAASQSLS
jgi:hypothetical protein